MIRLIIAGVRWGTDPIEEVNQETGDPVRGRQLNLLDEQSGILVQVPFSGDPLKNLIKELAGGLTDDQRREIASTFNGGVILPGLPGNQTIKRGPQG